MSLKSLMPFARSNVPSRGGYDVDPFTAMRRDMDRFFDDMMKGFGSSSNGLPVAFTGAAAPRIDVKETETGLEVSAELPGVDEKDVEVELQDDVLTIRGEKKIEKEEGDKEKGYHLMERSYGSFARSITLPFEADSEKVSADFSKGVLKVVIPRPATAVAKTKKIEVKAK
ncbi:Hsp20/alpha crystallin family protein [Dongia sedimenti]|uniref:Hsp20/alpha crystallin family protein n=1 Tax=Dongia sedimenti TaxID=3064282 RepID=A0ABU0YT92_9PROT|nr:Hsp20/alpha crystallin family protein [Rhodospirillaceae bacterium R-7]